MAPCRGIQAPCAGCPFHKRRLKPGRDFVCVQNRVVREGDTHTHTRARAHTHTLCTHTHTTSKADRPKKRLRHRLLLPRGTNHRANPAPTCLQEVRKKLENLERIKRNVKVARDPSRLTQATASSRARAADKASSGGRVIARAPPRRAVPSWRQGI